MAFRRRTKQFIIAFIFWGSVIAFFTALYFGFFYTAPTCFDGKWNQDEQGIDCGGSCSACQETVVGEDFLFEETSVLPGGDGRYDVFAKVRNPNSDIGATSFHYVFEIKDASGAVLATDTGESSLLPRETRYLMSIGLASSSVPATASIKVSDVSWEKFSGFGTSTLFSVYDQRFELLYDGTGFGAASGLVANESPYDFRSVYVKVILRDSTGKAIAFNKTKLDSLVSHEQRDFRLVWPTAFAGTVARVEVEADADFYHADSFINQYLPSGRSQEFSAPSQTYY